MRIIRVRAKNFRAIAELDLGLGPLTVAVGPNGAGKSSFMELLHLFATLENPAGLVERFAGWGGYGATVFYGANEPRIGLGISLSDESDGVDYDIELFGEQHGFFVKREILRPVTASQPGMQDLLHRDDSHVEVVLEHQNTKIAKEIRHGAHTCFAAQLRGVPVIDYLQPILKRISHWQLHKFQPSDRVRGPQQLQPTSVCASDGSNLLSALYTLKTERRNLYRELLESLQLAVPELEELEFPLAGAGHVNLTWKQRNFERPFYSNQLSDGILRFLFLMTILHTAPDDGLIMLDEPELSLHPQWLMLLVSILRKTSARTSILVATQSAELVRWLKPEELVIADMTEAGTTFSSAKDHPNLDKWLEDFTLAELWTMGELGGRR